MRFFSSVFSLLLLSLINNPSVAMNPPDGIYGGILVGGSITPNITFPTPGLTINNSSQAEVIHSPFGNLAFDLGYRWCAQWRVELELLINYNPYKEIKVGGYTITKRSKYKSGLGISGQTTTGAIMVNGFYDLFTPGSTTSFAPYVGIGIGYSDTQNKLTIYDNNVAIAGLSYSESATAPAVQGIVGLGYFLDDYSSVGLDVRYFSTSKISPSNQRLTVTSINFSFIGSFS